MALFADGPLAAVPLRFATGAFLAGVYPVCMKLMASWSPPADRALAMGALIGCLALGSALPHLIDGLGQLNWRAVLTAAAATAFCAAIVAGALVRPGPQFPAGGGTGRRYALAMFSDRGPRLVSLAYFGHMWELYALWSLVGFFLAGRAERSEIALVAFATVGAGFVGCAGGGWISRRVGERRVALTALVASGTLCLLSGLAYALPTPALYAYLVGWGIVAVADSPQFSALAARYAPPEYTATALTVQNGIGFAVTVVSLQVLPLLAAHLGWRWVFTTLAVGPFLGAVYMVRLGRIAR
jgi:MFS family permease